MLNVLFVVYGGGHARLVRPVIDYILDNYDCVINCLALTGARRELEGIYSDRFNVLGYKDFFFGEEVGVYGNRLMQDLLSVIDEEETVAYLGQNYLELLDACGADEAARVYKQGGRQIFLPINSLKTIINQIGPDKVVTTNSPRSEKAALIAARELGVESIAIIDMFSVRCESWLKNYADTVCVFDQGVKDALVGAGRAAEVIVTGNPAFDSLVSECRKNRDVLIASKKALPFTVLWASQREPKYAADLEMEGSPELPLAVEKELIEIFKENSDWRLVVRNHPNEEPRVYPSYIEVSTQDEQLGVLLSRVHVVVTLTSTVGFQGRIFGCELVTIDGSVFSHTVPYSKIGYSIGLGSPAELSECLSAVEERIRQTPVLESPYAIDDAVVRVAEQILK